MSYTFASYILVLISAYRLAFLGVRCVPYSGTPGATPPSPPPPGSDPNPPPSSPSDPKTKAAPPSSPSSPGTPQTVYVGTLCGSNAYYDPSLKVCVPRRGQDSHSRNETRRRGKPYASAEDPVPIRISPKHVEHNDDQDDEISREVVNAHCGMGYEWSPTDKLCVKYAD